MVAATLWMQAGAGVTAPDQTETTTSPLPAPLHDLFERAGCKGESAPLTRWQAAVLLQRCLAQAELITAPLARLLRELDAELTTLSNRVEQLEQHHRDLDASRFSPTTRLLGVSTFIVGGNGFSGTDEQLLNSIRSTYGAVEFGYDQKLILRTSFTGRDRLNIRLRAGNLDTSNDVFGGGGPSKLSELEVAFQQGRAASQLGVNRLWYQFPIGEDWTVTLGSRVNQSVMLAMWPSVYPEDTVLDLFTQAGASGAYSSNLGAGGGVMWERGPFSLSLNYIAANGADSGAAMGLFEVDAGSSSTLQLGYAAERWGVAAALVTIENGAGIINYASPFTLSSFNQPGTTLSTAISGYWQPSDNGLIPSVSLGWGWNSTRYSDGVDSAGLVSVSQSWTVALQWSDLFDSGTSMGAAIGQPVFATALVGGGSPNDAGYVMEWWTMFPVTDSITVTPAVFYLSRPLGAETPNSQQLNQLGALVKTTFRF